MPGARQDFAAGVTWDPDANRTRTMKPRDFRSVEDHKPPERYCVGLRK